MLSLFVDENMADWDDHLPYLLMAYRSSVLESTGFSPNRMMLGREIYCPLDLMVGDPPEIQDRCPLEYVEWIEFTMRKTFEFAHKNLRGSALRQKNNYDRGLKPRDFPINSFVWR